jgi:hypothetical protein
MSGTLFTLLQSLGEGDRNTEKHRERERERKREDERFHSNLSAVVL